MEMFFLIAYALVIYATFALVSVLPAFALGLIAPRADRLLLLLPGAALGLFGWIWAGWLGDLYGISRLGLLLYTGVGATGFIYGWSTGLTTAAQTRARRARTRSSPR